MAEVVGVQFLKGGGIYYFLYPGKPLKPDSPCVVETDQGLQMVRVVRPHQVIADAHLPTPLKRILRVANIRDCEQLKNNERREREAYRLCRKKVTEKKLPMKLVDVTYTLDGRKAVFYFTAENRIDFRELVKDLAQNLKVKIEMRQIGVRDETRRLGGVGGCGRPLCCCTFLKDFVSVSIRMAKDQNLSLNPTKVSGLCGRLMCCLSYEYEGPGKKKKAEDKGEAKLEVIGPQGIPVAESGKETDPETAEPLPLCPKFLETGEPCRPGTSCPTPEKAAPPLLSTASRPGGQQAQNQTRPDDRRGPKRRNRNRRFWKPFQPKPPASGA